MKITNLILIGFLLGCSSFSNAQTYGGLISKAQRLYQTGHYKEALEQAELAHDNATKRFGLKDERYVRSLQAQGQILIQLGRFKEVDNLYIFADTLLAKTVGKNHFRYGEHLVLQANLLRIKGDYVQAEKYFQNGLNICGANHSDYAIAITQLACLHQSMGKFKEAEAGFVKAKLFLTRELSDIIFHMENLEIQREAESQALEVNANPNLFGTEFSETFQQNRTFYAEVLLDLGNLYQSTGRNQEAEAHFIEAKNMIAHFSGTRNPIYHTSLRNLASLYLSIGRFQEAKGLFQECQGLFEAALGSGQVQYSENLNSFANLYQALGQYEISEQLNLKACERIEYIYGPGHPKFANSLNGLADLYNLMGRYKEAEELYLKVAEKKLLVFGKYHPEYAKTLSNLAVIYQKMGRYNSALSVLERVLDILEQSIGTQNIQYASALNNIATLLGGQEKHQMAEDYFNEAIQIQKNILGKEHPIYASTLDNLANHYQILGHFETAESLHFEARNIIDRAYGENHPLFATSMHNLAKLYSQMDRDTEAEWFFLEAAEGRAKNLGTNHPEYASTLESSAQHKFKTGLIEPCVLLLDSAIRIQKKNLLENFGFLSEREKMVYWQSVQYSFDFLAGSVMAADDNLKQKTIGLALEHSLFKKQLVLRTEQSSRELLRGSKIPNVDITLGKLHSIKEEIAKLETLPRKKRWADADSLSLLANQYEKFLESQSKSTPGREQIAALGWKQIKNGLKNDEAAVEFTHFKYLEDGRETDSILYAAFILLHSDSIPQFIPLFYERDLQKMLRSVHQSSDWVQEIYQTRSPKGIRLKQQNYTPDLYSIIWRPIAPYLKEAQTIYYTPSGLLHNIAFDVIPIPENKVLSDLHHLIRLSSLMQLENRISSFFARDLKTAVVFGGIEYDFDTTNGFSEAQNEDFNRRNCSSISQFWMGDSVRGGNWSYLEGTMQEARKIDSVLSYGGVSSLKIIGRDAREESFKTLGGKDSPGLIHIPTHGFAFTYAQNRRGEPMFKRTDNPLMRCGLIFAGADRAWKGEDVPRGLEDGILTAYEVSNMNLRNTKLVVLSACESGLGEILGKEGVFGLQRGFKLAGVQYVLMTLWQVPDKETVEFMEAFYEAFLNGEEVHLAFKKAQTKMKKKYKGAPYKWGGFVLVE